MTEAHKIAKLKAQNKNLTHKIRNMRIANEKTESKKDFSDNDKLMIVEGVLLSVIGTAALDHITRRLMSSLSDDNFWQINKNKCTNDILVALAKK